MFLCMNPDSSLNRCLVQSPLRSADLQSWFVVISVQWGPMYSQNIMTMSVAAYSGFRRCHCRIVCLGFEIMSCQCFVSEAPLPFLPANNMRPISSLRPMLSKSMTMTSRLHSRIFSQGTLNENCSLKIGFRVHLKMGVFRFSTRFSPNCNHTLT